MRNMKSDIITGTVQPLVTKLTRCLLQFYHLNPVKPQQMHALLYMKLHQIWNKIPIDRHWQIRGNIWVNTMAIVLLTTIRTIVRLETGSPTPITTMQSRRHRRVWTLAIVPKLVHKFVKGKPPPIWDTRKRKRQTNSTSCKTLPSYDRDQGACLQTSRECANQSNTKARAGKRWEYYAVRGIGGRGNAVWDFMGKGEEAMEVCGGVQSDGEWGEGRNVLE